MCIIPLDMMGISENDKEMQNFYLFWKMYGKIEFQKPNLAQKFECKKNTGQNFSLMEKAFHRNET